MSHKSADPPTHNTRMHVSRALTMYIQYVCMHTQTRMYRPGFEGNAAVIRQSHGAFRGVDSCATSHCSPSVNAPLQSLHHCETCWCTRVPARGTALRVRRIKVSHFCPSDKDAGWEQMCEELDLGTEAHAATCTAPSHSACVLAAQH